MQGCCEEHSKHPIGEVACSKLNSSSTVLMELTMPWSDCVIWEEIEPIGPKKVDRVFRTVSLATYVLTSVSFLGGHGCLKVMCCYPAAGLHPWDEVDGGSCAIKEAVACRLLKKQSLGPMNTFILFPIFPF